MMISAFCVRLPGAVTEIGLVVDAAVVTVGLENLAERRHHRLNNPVTQLVELLLSGLLVCGLSCSLGNGLVVTNHHVVQGRACAFPHASFSLSLRGPPSVSIQGFSIMALLSGGAISGQLDCDTTFHAVFLLISLK